MGIAMQYYFFPITKVFRIYCINFKHYTEMVQYFVLQRFNGFKGEECLIKSH